MDVSIRLFGDGSLRAEERRGLDGLVRASWNAQLSAEQVERILRDAVDNGLMEYDDRQVRVKKEALKRREPSATDMPGSFVEIHLVSLEDEHGSLSGPISRRIAAMNAQRGATLYPEIAELGALARLLNTFSTQYLAMKGVVKP